jgi:hypothetical protein
MTGPRRIAAALTAVLLSLGAALGLVATNIIPADAATTVTITKVRADSPGADRGSNASKNAEYVVIKNTAKKSIKLGGYVLRDANGHSFAFPSGFVLKAGRSVAVHTGVGKNTNAHLYWGQRWYVWNNDKDVAKLQKSGKTLSSFSYKRVTASGFGVK